MRAKIINKHNNKGIIVETKEYTEYKLSIAAIDIIRAFVNVFLKDIKLCVMLNCFLFKIIKKLSKEIKQKRKNNHAKSNILFNFFFIFNFVLFAF